MNYGEVFMAVKTSKKDKDKNNTNKTNTNITPFEQELIDTMKKIKDYKLACESNIVSIIYKNIDHIYNLNLTLEDFSNNIWKVYWQIANDIIIKEKKKILDEITIGLYLEKHLKLKEKYDEYGGYETLENAKTYVKEENLDAYISELRKWNVVIKLLKMKFPVQDRLKNFVDMTAEEIHSEFEAKLNHVFINVDGEIKRYDITDELDELIDELDEGLSTVEYLPPAEIHIPLTSNKLQS